MRRVSRKSPTRRHRGSDIETCACSEACLRRLETRKLGFKTRRIKKKSFGVRFARARLKRGRLEFRVSTPFPLRISTPEKHPTSRPLVSYIERLESCHGSYFSWFSWPRFARRSSDNPRSVRPREPSPVPLLHLLPYAFPLSFSCAYTILTNYDFFFG